MFSLYSRRLAILLSAATLGGATMGIATIGACGASEDDGVSPGRADAAAVDLADANPSAPDGAPSVDDPDADVSALTGESCAAPELLDLEAGPAIVTGTTTGYVHDHNGPPACNVGLSQVDRVFTVPVAAGDNVEAAISGDGSESMVVAVQKACPDTSVAGGCAGGSPMAGFDWDKTFDEAGSAYIFVWGAEGIDYTLTVTKTLASN